jgi:HAD superfamily hydrolase (TIGR01484 family)
MHFRALASDFDGTLAHDGHVDEPTLRAVERWKQSAGKFVLVTGRELPDLRATFPRLDVCDLIVAENGAILYWPQSQQEKVLAKPPLDEFLTAARHRGVVPFSMGRVIFATWRPHETTVLQVIQELGADYQIIFNKDAVMVLPTGVNKATGLTAALEELKIAPEHVAGVGDAENDHAFLEICGVSVAVDNALPLVKQQCDWVTAADHGAGVVELIDRLLGDEASLINLRSARLTNEGFV